MLGRIDTGDVFYPHATQNAHRHTNQLSILQQQASTGLRLLNPSDDPAATRVCCWYRRSRTTASKRNSAISRTRRHQAERQRVEPGRDQQNLRLRAQDIALEGNQSDQGEVLAQEVDGLIDRLLTIANTQHDGQYIFSGTAVKTQPFVADDQGVHYVGSSDRMQVSLDRTVWMDTFYSGSEVLQ